jgi:hypothetical protein
MDNQQQHGESVSKDWADLQMPETARELSLQSEAIEQRLEHDQAGEGGQALVFKPDLGKAMGFAMNGGSATLHPNGLRWLIWAVWCLQFYQLRGRFFITGTHRIASFFGVCWIALSVNSS